jgi:hypothetical protein
MASDYTVNGVDLDTIFKARSSTKRADIGIKVGGVDMSNRYEPTNGSDQITTNTDIKINNTDLRYIFQNYNYAPPTYSISRSASTVNEGSQATFTLTTTNVSNGTIVPYTITGVSSADIGNSSLTGNFTVNNNSATLTLNITADLLTEGVETLTLTLAINNASASISIGDTSLSTVNHKSIFTFGGYSDTDENGNFYSATFEMIGNTAGAQYEYYFFGRSYDSLYRRYYTWGQGNGGARTLTQNDAMSYNQYSAVLLNPCGGWRPSNGKWMHLDDNQAMPELNYIRVKNKNTGATQDIGVGIILDSSGITTNAPTIVGGARAGIRFVSYNSRGCQYGSTFLDHLKVELDLDITI